jgi:hypothetical protein
MRVCQPAPVAFHRSMTSVGSRKEISLRGLVDTGLPPLLTFARAEQYRDGTDVTVHLISSMYHRLHAALAFLGRIASLAVSRAE